MQTATDYFKTLRRIPKDIILSLATREFNMLDGNTCICGWALRESLARAAGGEFTAENMSGIANWPGDSIPMQCHTAFGGMLGEWHDLYTAVTGRDLFPIERAFVRRVKECVR